MADLIASALSATRETRQIEFKETFDTTSQGEWCELSKDLTAIANSGGGIIVFGLDSRGAPSGASASVFGIDPADITNRVFKYTGFADFDVDIRELQKNGRSLGAFLISAAQVPLVFSRPGTYDVGGGKQKTAFSLGTVYFRHGSKSEPGTTGDLESFIARRVNQLRKEWTKGIRKVVHAPAGSQVVMVRETTRGEATPSGNIRLTNDSGAIPVILTRDTGRQRGVFIREELADGIFDEINNVIDANRALAKGQERFMLGLNLYYRIYAERQHVDHVSGHASLLLHAAVTDLYPPSLFWLNQMADEDAAVPYSELVVRPKSPQVHALLRIAVMLGDDFRAWLLGKWNGKWGKHPQPPAFFFTFQQLCAGVGGIDNRASAARLGPTKLIQCFGEKAVAVSELLKDEDAASSLLSRTCMRVFEGHGEERSIARDLDYIAHGGSVHRRSVSLGEAIIAAVGDKEVGEPADTPPAQQVE